MHYSTALPLNTSAKQLVVKHDTIARYQNKKAFAPNKGF
jgi:hypothetical protein